jgi:hypothetical protein
MDPVQEALKHTDPTDPDSDPDPQHCKIQVSNAPAVNEVLESESGEEQQLLLHRDRLTKQQRLEIECKKARYQVIGSYYFFEDLTIFYVYFFGGLECVGHAFCFCRPFFIFETCLDWNSESCSKQALPT